MRSSQEPVPTSRFEEPTNSYSISRQPTPPVATDAANIVSANIPIADVCPHSLLSSNSATSRQTEVEESGCAQCDQIYSSTHYRTGCHKLVHTICGHSAGQEEGFGSPVWCTECSVNARAVNLLEGRRAQNEPR